MSADEVPSSNMMIFKRSGSTIFGAGGRKSGYGELASLLNEGISFKIYRTSDGRDITQRVLETIRRKMWTDEEISALKNNYGKLTLPELHTRLLPEKSVGQIRHKASKLGLTVDAKWQSHEIDALTALRRSGVSFPQIAKILQRPVHACEVKAHKLGIVYGGRANESLEQLEEDRSKYQRLGAQAKGRVAENLTAVRLTVEGFDVFQPFFPQHKTDLVAQAGKRIVKIQVKSAIWERKTGRFRCPLRVKNPRNHQRKPYDKSDVDFFILVCLGVDAFYVVPFQLAESYSDAHLYPHRPKRIQKGLNWERFRNSFDLMRENQEMNSQFP